MLAWRIMCLISIVILVIVLFILVKKNFIKNTYFHEFRKDELYKSTKSKDSINSIYSTCGQTRKYIKRYALTKTNQDRFLVCNYNEDFESISYYIMVYDKKGKVLEVLEVNDTNTSNTSRVLGLHRKCSDVNIYIRSVDNVDINSQIIKPLTKFKINIYSIFSSFAVFLFLFSFRHLIIEIIGTFYAKEYLNSYFNYIAIAVCFLITLLYFVFTIIKLRRRNVKNRNGGALYYEFF